MITLTPEAAAALLARMEELERVAQEFHWAIEAHAEMSARCYHGWPSPQARAEFDQLWRLRDEADNAYHRVFDVPMTLSLLSLIRWQRERIEELERGMPKALHDKLCRDVAEAQRRKA